MTEPLYKKIYNQLKQDITNGLLTVDSQLPTEKELSKHYQVSRITSKRALTELEQDGYIFRIQGKGSFVKLQEQNSSNNTSKKILFVLPFANDLSVGNFNEGIYEILKDSGYEFMMTPTDFITGINVQTFMKEFAGLIYYAGHNDSHLDLLFELSIHNFPVVILDKKIYELPYPTVYSDNNLGGKLATQHLIQNSHTNIAYLFAEKNHPQSVKQRYLGYLSAIKEASLSFHTKFDDEQALSTNAINYIKQHNITGIVCENDLVAINLMKELKLNNYQIPQDISIIGFDNIQAASLVDPGLDTIAQDFTKIGYTAGKILLKIMQQPERIDVNNDERVPITLIKRQSTQKITT